MNKLLALPILSLAALLPTAFGRHIQSSQRVPSKISQITLERTRCYGTCPAYKVTIKSDGTVLYHGEAFVSRSGNYKAMVWSYPFQRLPYLLNKLGYWKMNSSYRTFATDQPTQILTIVSNLGTKTVSEYGHEGPPELWAIQTLVDGMIADAQDWEKVAKK